MKISDLSITPMPSDPLRPEKDAIRQRKFDGLRDDLLTLGVLATVCLGAGLAVNQFRDRPLPLVYVSKEERMKRAVSKFTPDNSASGLAVEKQITAAKTTESGGVPRVINMAEFRSFIEAKRGVVLDARPEIFHRLGHVPGALSLPREEFESAYAKQRALLEQWRDKAVAVYCSSESCEDSQMVTDALAKLGYQNVLVFKGGWDEWTRAGLPEEHQ